jgi:hypothetical protein
MAGDHRRTTVELVVHLAEFEARDLHLAAGYRSLFAYCTGVLKLSESEAYHRIEAARDAGRFPVVLDRLASGSLTLTNLRLLSGHLKPENHLALLDEAAGKSKRQVQEIVARMAPRPDVRASVRKVPERPSAVLAVAATSNPATPAVIPPVASVPALPIPQVPRDHAAVTPLSPARYEVRFTASAATRAKLDRARDLLRHAVPSGDLAEVFDRALTLLIKDLERRKFASVNRPRSGMPEAPSQVSSRSQTRHVPAAVRRIVATRDGHRCTFVSASGTRCEATAFLEFHHLDPYAAGGAKTATNLRLRCGPHNRHEARLYFDPIRHDRLLHETDSVQTERTTQGRPGGAAARRENLGLLV